jgi:hypothetical protein
MGSSDAASVIEPVRSFIDILLGFGTDFFAFIVLASVIAVFAFYFGGDRLMPLIASLYAAIPLYTNFPFLSSLPNTPYVLIGLYLTLAVIALIAFSGLSYFMASSTVGFLNIAVLSGLTAGLFLAIAIHILPIEEVYTLSEPTKALFTSENAFFWWLAAPLAGLFFFGRG